ncbi:hypothetical protein MRX96_011736 [Rhipicephalus microplus]
MAGRIRIQTDRCTTPYQRVSLCRSRGILAYSCWNFQRDPVLAGCHVTTGADPRNSPGTAGEEPVVTSVHVGRPGWTPSFTKLQEIVPPLQSPDGGAVATQKMQEDQYRTGSHNEK